MWTLIILRWAVLSSIIRHHRSTILVDHYPTIIQTNKSGATGLCEIYVSVLYTRFSTVLRLFHRKLLTALQESTRTRFILMAQ